MRLYHYIAGLLFPPKCILCRKILKNEELDLCKPCRIHVKDCHMVKTDLQFLDSFAAVWYYEENVRKSILRFKFYGARHLASGYGRILAMRILRAHPEGFDQLTWIPVSPLRRLRRGYDQGALLAKAVGRELGIKPVPLLRKVRHNTAQSGLQDDGSRRDNVRGVYRVRPGMQIAGQRILLLDDVLTTGATAGEAARVLREAGAKEVHCAALAAARKE